MFCDVPISDPQAKRADAESGHRVSPAAQFSRNTFVSVAKPVPAADRSQNATRLFYEWPTKAKAPSGGNGAF